MAGHITPAEVVHLVRHLAECRPDDRPDAVRVEDTLRHFRRVAIEESPVNNLGGSNERT